MESLSEPIYQGLRGGSKIRGGIDVDIAKSALQKAIRRNDVWLALTMALRLNEFKDFGKPIHSNLINRLPVIAGEDVGMANLKTVKIVDEYVEKIRNSQDSCVETLIEIVLLMCASEKSRLGSHVNAVYYQALSTPLYYDRLNLFRPSILKEFEKNDEKMEDEQDLDHFLIEKILNLLGSKDSSEDKKMMTFFYLRSLLNSNNKYKIPRGYPKKRNIQSEPIFIIWNELLKMNKDEMIEILYKQFLNENERHIYLVLAMMVFFFGNEVERKEYDVKKMIQDLGGVEKIVNYAMYTKVIIPDYAIDKHTKKGRSSGKDGLTFVLEGAYVENESEWSKKWKILGEIYVDYRKFMSQQPVVPKPRRSKTPKPSNKSEASESEVSESAVSEGAVSEGKQEIIDSPMKTTERISKEERIKLMSDETPRGQILTSKWKKYVYIPIDEPFVYKGRWNKNSGSSKERNKLKNLKFRFDVCERMKANVLTGKIIQDDEDNLWIRYRNMNIIPPSDWMAKKVLDTVSEKEIIVLDRLSMGITPLAYYAHDEKTTAEYLFGEKKLFCDFILLYVLGVGDTGLYNVLLGKYGPLIIDIDDDTTKTKFEHVWSIFGRKPNMAVVKVLEEGVKRERDYLKNYLNELESKLEEIRELALENRVKDDVEIWKNKIENVRDVILK
jgi:hypothetical protein